MAVQSQQNPEAVASPDRAGTADSRAQGSPARTGPDRDDYTLDSKGAQGDALRILAFLASGGDAKQAHEVIAADQIPSPTGSAGSAEASGPAAGRAESGDRHGSATGPEDSPATPPAAAAPAPAIPGGSDPTHLRLQEMIREKEQRVAADRAVIEELQHVLGESPTPAASTDQDAGKKASTGPHEGGRGEESDPVQKYPTYVTAHVNSLYASQKANVPDTTQEAGLDSSHKDYVLKANIMAGASTFAAARIAQIMKTEKIDREAAFERFKVTEFGEKYGRAHKTWGAMLPEITAIVDDLLTAGQAAVNGLVQTSVAAGKTREAALAEIALSKEGRQLLAVVGFKKVLASSTLPESTASTVPTGAAAVDKSSEHALKPSGTHTP